jgi:hypothetical protein
MVGTGIHGYSAQPVEQAYRDAQEMFDEATSAAERYPVMRGLAAAHLLRGDLRVAHQYSIDALGVAESAGRPDYRIDAISLLAYATLYFGRLEDCRRWIERCLDLYEAERGDTLRYPAPQDAKTAALALLPTVAWLMGDPEGAENAIQAGLAHVTRLGRDFDKANFHAWIAGTRYTQRRYLEAAQHAGLAYTIAQAHQLQQWIGVGGMMALLSQAALQPSPAIVAQAIEAGRAFKAAGVGLNASYFLWGIARGFFVAGNADGAKAMLLVALETAAASEETRMKPEIWMLQAELEADPDASARLLRAAYDLAGEQGAVANAARAAAMLVARTSSDDAARDQARSTLGRLDGASASGAPSNWMTADLAQLREFLPRSPVADGAAADRPTRLAK